MRLNLFHSGRNRGHGRYEGRRFAHDDEGRLGHDEGAERGHRGGRHGRHSERGGLGRFFDHGDLKLVVLALVAEKPRHGYEIIKDIEDRVGGAYSPSPGVVYPTLTFLTETGLLTMEVAGGKKLHSITPEGLQFLEANRTTVNALLARISEAGRARASADAPPVIRGMENLKLALRMRVGRGPLTAEQVRNIAAALDAAAIAIEQS